jgi:hypothetical protein
VRVPQEECVEYGVHFLPVDIFFAMTPRDMSREEVIQINATNSLFT